MSQLGVALVSAGSALAGATVGGIFNLLRGRQESKERQTDRDEERRQRRLDSRRSAYVSFLSKLSDLEDEYQHLHSFQLPDTEDRWEAVAIAALAARNRLFQARIEVEMAGPAVMAAQADRVLQQATILLEEYDEAYPAHKDRSDTATFYDLVPGMGRVINRLNVQRDRFIGAARVQLDGDVNEIPAEIMREHLGSLGDFDN